MYTSFTLKVAQPCCLFECFVQVRISPSKANRFFYLLQSRDDRSDELSILPFIFSPRLKASISTSAQHLLLQI